MKLRSSTKKAAVSQEPKRTKQPPKRGKRTPSPLSSLSTSSSDRDGDGETATHSSKSRSRSPQPHVHTNTTQPSSKTVIANDASPANHGPAGKYWPPPPPIQYPYGAPPPPAPSTSQGHVWKGAEPHVNHNYETDKRYEKEFNAWKPVKKKTPMACHLCRSRKRKCNGVQPTCDFCTDRAEPCTWDGAPRRRGPGKKPSRSGYKDKQGKRTERVRSRSSVSSSAEFYGGPGPELMPTPTPPQSDPHHLVPTPPAPWYPRGPHDVPAPARQHPHPHQHAPNFHYINLPIMPMQMPHDPPSSETSAYEHPPSRGNGGPPPPPPGQIDESLIDAELGLNYHQREAERLRAEQMRAQRPDPYSSPRGGHRLYF